MHPTTIMTLRILTLLIAVTTSAFCADLPGLYREDIVSTVTKVRSGKSIKKERKTSRQLELNKDNTLRFSSTRKDKIRDYEQYQGVWAEHNGRVFYYMVGCGEYQYLTIGSSILKKEGNALNITSPVGIPLIRALNPQLKSVDSLEFPIDIDLEKTDRMKANLAEFIKNIPDVQFEGCATEGKFKQVFHAAIKAGDVPTLMKLTQPQPKERITDLNLHYYFKYIADLKREGVYAIADDKDIEKYTSMFPSQYSVKGHFKMVKKVDKSSSGSYWFYGIVDGRWALIGNPQSKK